ncbi:MAG TPA: hypothetical protein VN089_21545 [Duganella sp.]|nr:hypothetical protein [Duganella sp.]
MNKLSLTVLVIVFPFSTAAGAATSDAALPQQSTPVFETRSNSTLLFEAADRQSALVDQLRTDGARRYAAFAGAPRLHFGALPENLSLLDPLGPLLTERRRRYLTSAEFEKKTGRAVGILTIGLLRETGSMLGGGQPGTSWGVNSRPTTTFTSLSLGYSLTPRSSVMAMASYGKTDGFGAPDSLMAQVSSVRTMAFSVGVATRQIFGERDRLAVTLAVPAKVRTGMQNADSDARVNYANGQGFGVPTLNLRPTATERDLEFGYTTMLGKAGNMGKVTGAVMLRVNPGHDANARPDVLTGVRYSYGF